MAATAALSSAMDIIDEHDDNGDSSEKDLIEQLSNTRLDEPRTDTDTDTDIQMKTSEESNELPTPEGFFIDSKSNASEDEEEEPLLHNSSSLPAWPITPPKTSSSNHIVDSRAISSCPRPSSSSTTTAAVSGSGSKKSNHHPRPLFVSSSSGALMPPPIESSIDDAQTRRSYEQHVDGDDIDDDLNTCPATRAAAAIQALDTELDQQQQQSSTPKSGTSIDISRQDTFHTSHHSGLHLADKMDDCSDDTTPRYGSSSASASGSGYNNNAYPSHANEPIPNRFMQHDENDDTIIISSLYTFTPHTLSGKVLTALSKKFVSKTNQHTHGGSALAGFLALLLVTCANYMLGPMRDAAALAVGVSHIPALTLASTVLALGSSVPVGWLFEAPNPMRRRVWKRMGLTRGETQGTSLALFYRVFAFLLLSYAVGFKIVDKFGKRNNGIGEDDDDDDEKGETESAIVLVVTFFLRLLGGLGIPISKIISSMEQFAGDAFGMTRIISSAGIHATFETYAQESIPTLFVHIFKCVVNKFGKVIYIMFFLVVHLMKLHSLSLIWGVTTEAMEYEENAEQRRAMKEKEGVTRGTSAGGLVMMGSPSKRKDDDDNKTTGEGNTSQTGGGESSSSSKPSKSSLRLKRLGFVGFGGTLGGILGSVIASFAAHILHLSGLLIVAAILLEISANLSVELGRIMQRHWEEQMKYQSCGDLASLASAENLAGQNNVDSSMRKSVSLGSMKRVASGSLSSGNLAQLAAQQQQQQQQAGMTRAKSSISLSSEDKAKVAESQTEQQPMIDDNSFKQRLLRGITTIIRSRLLMSIFTYNALYASTSVLLSFQRAELVANRSSSGSSAISNTAFLAKINTASSVAVFALQASGLGAYIANKCGQRGALALMPIIRSCGVILLGWWHLMSDGKPPDLISFLMIDEFTKVINFAIAKPVRENLWRGLSAEARYEAKPIVDTLANRWGGGSAALLVSFISRITDLTGLGVVKENGDRSIFGFPPVLLLCMIISAWWTAVSADVGNIRRKIDAELKKQQS